MHCQNTKVFIIFIDRRPRAELEENNKQYSNLQYPSTLCPCAIVAVSCAYVFLQNII